MARGLFFVFFENRYSVRFFCLFLPQDYRISAPFPALLCCCAGSFTRGTKCEELIHFPNNFFPRRSFRCLYFSTFIPIINSDNFGAEKPESKIRQFSRNFQESEGNRRNELLAVSGNPRRPTRTQKAMIQPNSMLKKNYQR